MKPIKHSESLTGGSSGRAFRGARPVVVLILVVAMGCLVSGCVTATFTKPVGSLKSSIDTASTAVGTYFTELNDFERELYLEARIYDPRLRIEKVDSDGKPTALVGCLFSAESIKARMDAISLLGTYANRLAELAGSDAPQKFSSSAQALGTNVGTVISAFGSLGGGDTTAKDYVGPLSQIVGMVGEFYLEQKREVLLERGINDGAPQVNRVLDLIESDLQTVIVPLRRTGIAQSLAVRVSAYNNTRDDQGRFVDGAQAREKMTVAQRRDLIDGIRSAAQQYDAFMAFNPTDAIEGIRNAHAALLKYAQSGKTPKDFSELMTAVEALQLKVERVAVAVKQIRDLRSRK